ncbi:MAG: YggS family pyridoxal phosphate-dependent enzyme [Betaproteobacteria bacterium]|nr:YggS family pyridoxal phosphate-dependent enzyme [Betaproteobacteria bacterium]
MATINDNLQAVGVRILRAARAVWRDPATVRLLAVSKTQPPAAIVEAFATGQRSFGENYVQEALDKQAVLVEQMGAQHASTLEWHLIGPLQSNKTRTAAECFDWVHTIDRAKVARRLSDSRAAHAVALNVLIQVNVSGESTKSGVPPAQVAVLAREVAGLPRLRLRGLMAIPEPTDDTSLQRERFRMVREIFETLACEYPSFDTLSMGMSQDLESAVAEGATMVRIGTAVFGNRHKVKVAA